MTYIINPTCELPITVDWRGGLRLPSVAFGRGKAALLAGFCDLIKKPAFFIKKSAQLVNLGTKLPNGATELLNRVTALPNVATKLLNVVTELPNFVRQLLNVGTTLLNFAAMLLNGVRQLLNFATTLLNGVRKLLNFAAKLPNFLTTLLNFATELTQSKPDNRAKMAQNATLRDGLKSAKTPGTPGINFIKKFAGAEVTRLEAEGYRDFLRRLLHVINFNFPILKNGIPGVVYTDNNSAAGRSLRPGG
jgi:hypothetical protein